MLYPKPPKNDGSIIVGLLFAISVGFLIYKYYVNKPVETPASQTLTEDGLTAGPDPVIAENELEVTTLNTNFDYPGSGKATRKYSQGEYELNISAVLPALSEGGYYEAVLDGPSTVKLGRLKKTGTTLKLNYTSTTNLMFHDEIRITVNGADFTIEENSRTLPFVIMEGSFN